MLGLTAHETCRAARSTMHHPHVRLRREGCIWAAQQSAAHACTLGGLLQRGTDLHGGHRFRTHNFQMAQVLLDTLAGPLSASPKPCNAPSASPGDVTVNPRAFTLPRPGRHGPRRSNVHFARLHWTLLSPWPADLLRQQLQRRSQGTC